MLLVLEEMETLASVFIFVHGQIDLSDKERNFAHRLIKSAYWSYTEDHIQTNCPCILLLNHMLKAE